MKIFKWIILDVILLFGVAALAQDKPKDPPKPETKVEASIVPPDTWLQTYDEYLALSRIIEQTRQEAGLPKLEAIFNQKTQELTKGIPKGYHFNGQTKKFDKDPEAPKPEPQKPGNGDKK